MKKYINEGEEIKVDRSREKSNLADIAYSHSSWGMLQINRITGSGGESFFGSSIKHNNAIAIRLHRAVKHRSLARDWYMDDGKEMMEVYLSPAQFAEAITNMNCGCGTPCTIKSFNGDSYKFAQETTKIEEHTKEFENTIKKVAAKSISLVENAAKILSGKGNMSVKDRELILNELKALSRDIHSNIPFYKTQFDEQVEKTITEAKAEIEAFVTNTIHAAGVASIAEKNSQIRLNESTFEKQ